MTGGRFSQTRRALPALLLGLLATSSVLACNIPVFRYALERWAPDNCEIIVFAPEPLQADDEKMIRDLEHQASGAGGNANLTVRRCDPRQSLDNELTGLWKQLPRRSDDVQPYVLVRSRVGRDRIVNHWTGPLADAYREGLVTSPVRTELIRRLQSGDAVVWLLVKSPDTAATATVRQRLEAQCRELPSQIELPEGIGLPGSELYSEVPLLLQFSVLEVDPADSQEQYLVRQLTGFRAATEAPQPLIVPVFGRGRALEVIPGDQLSDDLIQDLTAYLCAACSCQVKEQNPGFDLLMATNWEQALFPEGSQLPPPPAEPGTGQRSKPELIPIPSGSKPRGR
jgi:hypothetical protein